MGAVEPERPGTSPVEHAKPAYVAGPRGESCAPLGFGRVAQVRTGGAAKCREELRAGHRCPPSSKPTRTGSRLLRLLFSLPVVVAQTSVSRAQLADLARRGDAWHSAFEQRDGGAVAAVAGAASTAATSFVVGDGRTPLPPGPPTPQHLIPAQAPVAATQPVRAPGAANAPFAAAPLPASLSIPYPAALSLAPTQTGRPRAPSGGAASYFAPAAC